MARRCGRWYDAVPQWEFLISLLQVLPVATVEQLVAELDLSLSPQSAEHSPRFRPYDASDALRGLIEWVRLSPDTTRTQVAERLLSLLSRQVNLPA
jgi:hypothetical protein